jgi:hypothetical protein
MNMGHEELLNQIGSLLETYSKHSAYADKARERAEQFSSAVIEKVIADHQIKAALVADDIQPLIPLVAEELSKINSLIGEVEQSKGDLGERIEELELRKAIGEVSEEEFDSMTSDGKDTVREADEQIAAHTQARDQIQGVLDQWKDLSGEGVEAQPIGVEVAVEDDASEDEIDPVVDAILPGFESEYDADSVEIESISDEDSEGVAEAVVAYEMDDDVADEAVDVVPADEEADAGLVVDVAMDDTGIVKKALTVEDSEVADIGVDASEEGVEPFIEPEVDDQEEDNEAGDGESRRAILLSNEGTPDEQIYALTGEVFTVGRGRDNDLQIKNDSKVSRFHCKIYQRGANYYLEDNKSSNGSMVNGELISERRLFGGEELVIGETFFRFRVM